MALTKEGIIKHVEKYGTDYVQIDWPDLLNLKVHGVHRSRYIASWTNAGGKIDEHFYEWLLTIEFDDGTMSEEEADEIWDVANGGKMEFEISAKEYMKLHNIT